MAVNAASNELESAEIPSSVLKRRDRVLHSTMVCLRNGSRTNRHTGGDDSLGSARLAVNGGLSRFEAAIWSFAQSTQFAIFMHVHCAGRRDFRETKTKSFHRNHSRRFAICDFYRFFFSQQNIGLIDPYSRVVVAFHCRFLFVLLRARN